MKLVENFITKNDCWQHNLQRSDERYCRFQDEGPKGLMLHSVGCGEPTADVWVERWNKPGMEIMVHAFVEKDRVVQTFPWNYRAWHAGGKANNTHIGVEMTEPDTIVYPDPLGFVWEDKDPAATEAHIRTVYALSVELFASLCKEYNLDPLEDGVIISHNEGHQRGVASGHADPEHIWCKYGITMDDFRRDVAEKLAEIK
jgi:N-acetyl-anhydromuramyl-L-alanine amidase AmpD